MDKISTSSTIIAGDFNAKIRKRNGSEHCIGQRSRGRRNDSGFKLVEFCKVNNKVIANICFQHPAKHITTWSQKKISPTTKIVTNIYNQIDYIILDQKQKRTLTDTRSYRRTETSSYHRLVVARTEIAWPRLYHQRIQRLHQQKFDTKHLTKRKDAQDDYNEQIIQEIRNDTNKQYDKYKQIQTSGIY